MNDRNLVRGLFLMAISLTFGLASLRYQTGDFSRAGPGLFPLLVSSFLFLIALAIVVRSRFVPKLPLDLHVKNIGIIIGALCGFAVVNMFVNMIAAIVFLPALCRWIMRPTEKDDWQPPTRSRAITEGESIA